jgi:glycosyltransferase involved in cell wall biosynthesis
MVASTKLHYPSGPLVSIGVPVYNGERYLHECLESILKQTYPNWECHVINNRSTDRSKEIADSFEARDKRFRVITNEDFVDMTTNFNNTYKYLAEGAKYFKVVCADDWIMPEFLEKTVEVMEKYPSAGLCSAFRLDNRHVDCDGLNFYNGPLFSGKEVLLEQLSNKIMITGSETTVLYRVETLKKTKEYPVIYSYSSHHFDTSLAYELLSISDLGYVFQVLSYTRRHEATYTSKYTDRFRTNLNLRERELFIYKKMFPVLESEYKKVRADYGLYLLGRKLKRDKEALAWHDKRLVRERQFSFSELLSSFFVVFTHKVLNKIKHLPG